MLNFPHLRRSMLLVGALPLAVAATVAARHAFDNRPINAVAALPAPGSLIPDFHFQLLGGDSITSESMRGRVTVLAIWSLECGVSQRALVGIDKLRRDYMQRNVKVVILADDGDSTALRAALEQAHVETPLAIANGRLRRVFDRSRHAPERQSYRVRFGMPGFLVLTRTASSLAEASALRCLTTNREARDSMSYASRSTHCCPLS